MTSVAVIVPYFQKKPGILHRALVSILYQRLPAEVEVEVIVVDDGSPVLAKTEIEGLGFGPPFHLCLIEQPNSGVSAARNAGLRHVAKGTTHIAFLDSDDIWEPDYLAAALSALGAGYDFFFCDSRRSGHAQSIYSRCAFGDFLSSPAARVIGEGLYEVENDAFFDHSLRGRAFRIPAVAYRHSAAPSLIFNETLRTAGEDDLFLFQLIGKCRRLCCSTRELVTFADGINIYAGKFGWDSPHYTSQLVAHLLSFYAWDRTLSLSSENRAFLADRIKKVRRLFAFLTIRHILKGRKPGTMELVEMIRADSGFWLWYLPCAIYVSICWPLHLYDPLEKW
ncbi:MAG TPA: glycosyltransferase family 2 protein [Alphaproteobacteria bacterium]|nr:glycosyltransferase family 2 protein [Alphaproteobacteria bacterium]